VELQARQEPYPTKTQDVAINTAVAARVAGHRVVIEQGTPLAVHVDGTPVDLAQPVVLGPGASVSRAADGVDVDFPDGTSLHALDVGAYGINAVIQQSDALVGDGVGLLGPIAPGGLGVPALPDGTRLPAAIDAHARFQALYGPFADAWRVTDATSLFDYPPGKTTASYTNRAFPAEPRQGAVGPTTPDQLTTAVQACTAVTDPALNADCIFDVGATGDGGFATSYQATQAFYDAGIAAPSAPVTPTPGPTTAAVVSGAVKVSDVYAFGAAAISPTDVLYVSMQTTQTQGSLLAIDARSGAILQQAALGAPVTSLHFAAGSVWAADLEDGPGTGCLVTRFDGTTLAKQATVKVTCDAFGTAQIASNGDELWYLDTSTADGSGKPATLRRINPTTNATDSGVPLPFLGGRFFDSVGALFLGDTTPDRGMYRLTQGGYAFEALGPYAGVVYPAGTGFWQKSPDGTSAVLTTGPGAPAAIVQLTGGFLVAGDAQGIYVQQPAADGEELWRFPADGSPARRVATAPTVDGQPLDYAGNSLPSFTTADGYLRLWIPSGTASRALYLQWVARP